MCVIVECMEGKKMRWFGVWWSRNAMKGGLALLRWCGWTWTWLGGYMNRCFGAGIFERWMAPVR